VYGKVVVAAKSAGVGEKRAGAKGSLSVAVSTAERV
jgi:hypothetical protein